PVCQEGFKMVGLREAFDLLPTHIYNMAGKAAEILYWDANTKFCGVCGAPMKLHTDISKRCINCGKEVWPALAVAIIVAVSRNEGMELLMVQSRNFRGNYYGLVAGFVETGETLEECVQREVEEETGIRVKNICYVASQPWPYPSGLMVGFTAEYAGGELALQHSELKKGGWFSADSLPPIPGKVSLARLLIDRWLEGKKQGTE
ncbi:MAG: NAD(+) diphosphatase, partial [Bacteroidaceae bacterium]|nr:NAD(+) diphosphatase [Bacteroidaceae bacterium]